MYRAIDQFGQVIDVFVSPRRDAGAARRFFQRAIGATKVTPAEVTTDQVVRNGHTAGGIRGRTLAATTTGIIAVDS